MILSLVVQQAAYIIPDFELYFIMFLFFMFGFAPLALSLIRCPEALTFIQCQLFGGIIIERSTDAGVIEFVKAKPYGHEGQYIAGPDRFGRRIIFVVPRINGRDFAKRYIIKGIKRPLFDSYAGKTVLVNKEMLAATEVVEWEEKNKLPDNIAAWAKEQNLETTTIGYDKNGAKIIKTFIEVLFTMDSRKLRSYFTKYYDPSQFDNLLQREYIRGVNFGRGAKKGGGGSWIFILIAVLVVAAVVVVILYSKGILH